MSRKESRAYMCRVKLDNPSRVFTLNLLTMPLTLSMEFKSLVLVGVLGQQKLLADTLLPGDFGPHRKFLSLKVWLKLLSHAFARMTHLQSISRPDSGMYFSHWRFRAVTCVVMRTAEFDAGSRTFVRLLEFNTSTAGFLQLLASAWTPKACHLALHLTLTDFILPYINRHRSGTGVMHIYAARLKHTVVTMKHCCLQLCLAAVLLAL